MKKIILLVVLGMTGVLGACSGGGGSGDAATPQIATSDAIVKIPSGAASQGAQAFGANPLVVAPGTRVTWDNQDSVPHTVTAKDGSWDSGTLNGGEGVYSHLFTVPGDYTYSSTTSGDQNMTGTIHVGN